MIAVNQVFSAFQNSGDGLAIAGKPYCKRCLS